MNRLAAWLTGTSGISHVELRFSNGESLSVYQNETVFLRRRGYSNNQYVIMPLSGVSRQGEALMYTFARGQVGKAFNAWGMRRAALPWLFHRSTDGARDGGLWFCSELVASTLQQSGYLGGLSANAVSPNALYSIACKGRSYDGEYGDVTGPLNSALGMNSLAFQARKGGLDLRCFGGPGTGAKGRPARTAAAPGQRNGLMVLAPAG